MHTQTHTHTHTHSLMFSVTLNNLSIAESNTCSCIHTLVMDNEYNIKTALN